MSKLQIEIDVDGVLANMAGSYGKYVKDLLPDFTEEKYITDWDVTYLMSMCPEAGNRIQGLWLNPEFIYSLPRYDGVVDAMQKLGKYAEHKARLVIHTHIFTFGEVYESRKLWLEELRQESNVDFEIRISVGEHKDVIPNSDISIEDNVFNLQKSPAQNKFLVRRTHNTKFGADSLGVCSFACVVDSFPSSVNIISQSRLLESYRGNVK